LTSTQVTANFETMKIEFEYKISDILLIPGRALKAKKIIVASFFILSALAVYDLFTYLAVLIDGGNLSAFYSRYGLVPVGAIWLAGTTAKIVYYFGILSGIWVLMAGMAGVSIFDFEMMRGNPFFTSLAAIRFALSRFGQIFVSHLAIAIFLGFILLIGVLFGLLTRIPYLGDWMYALFLIFPNFIIAIFSVLIIFVLALSVLIMPATVAADRHGEAFNSILEIFTVITRQPFRWLGITVYSLVAAKISGFVFAYFSYRALQFLQFITQLGGGEKIQDLFASGAAHLPLQSPAVKQLTTVLPGLNFGFTVEFLNGAAQPGLAGYLMALSLFGVFVIIVAYIFSIIATGQSVCYAFVRKARDGHLFSNEKPLQFEPEWVNPPIKGPAEARPVDPTKM